MSDLISGIEEFMSSDILDPVNIENADARSSKKLVELIVKLTGSESALTCEERPLQDLNVRQPDLTKARIDPSWEPTVNVETRLEETIEHFERTLWTLGGQCH